MLAASAVLYSHAYPISLGPDTTEPLSAILGMSLGTLAVLSFFAISGYFISQSFQNRRGLIEFAAARALRIYPGLLAVLGLTVFALGPIFTRIDLFTYFSEHETFLYIPRNLALWRPQYELPGLFGDNIYPRAINGSLWTLAYEVACYAMVVAVGMLGFAANGRRFTGFVVVYAVCYVAAIPPLSSYHDRFIALRNIHLLTLPFVMGMSLFQFRREVPLRFSILTALGVVSAVSYRTPWFREIFVLTWSYAIFYVGFLQYKPLLVYNRLGDYSYGTYIYAFPVEQAVAALSKGSPSPVAIFLPSLPLTLLFAVLSWHLIEKRALARRSLVSMWLRHTMGTFVAAHKRRTLA
jgi:peptidoglycan/LPS O-acetylase OafA/YrhL